MSEIARVNYSRNTWRLRLISLSVEEHVHAVRMRNWRVFYVCCVQMAWMTMRCSAFIGWSLLRSWHTPPAPGGGFPVPLTGSDWTQLFVEVTAVVLLHQIFIFCLSSLLFYGLCAWNKDWLIDWFTFSITSLTAINYVSAGISLLTPIRPPGDCNFIQYMLYFKFSKTAVDFYL